MGCIWSCLSPKSQKSHETKRKSAKKCCIWRCITPDPNQVIPHHANKKRQALVAKTRPENMLIPVSKKRFEPEPDRFKEILNEYPLIGSLEKDVRFFHKSLLVDNPNVGPEVVEELQQISIAQEKLKLKREKIKQKRASIVKDEMTLCGPSSLKAPAAPIGSTQNDKPKTRRRGSILDSSFDARPNYRPVQTVDLRKTSFETIDGIDTTLTDATTTLETDTDLNYTVLPAITHNPNIIPTHHHTFLPQETISYEYPTYSNTDWTVRPGTDKLKSRFDSNSFDDYDKQKTASVLQKKLQKIRDQAGKQKTNSINSIKNILMERRRTVSNLQFETTADNVDNIPVTTEKPGRNVWDTYQEDEKKDATPDTKRKGHMIIMPKQMKAMNDFRRTSLQPTSYYEQQKEKLILEQQRSNSVSPKQEEVELSAGSSTRRKTAPSRAQHSNALPSPRRNVSYDSVPLYEANLIAQYNFCTNSCLGQRQQSFNRTPHTGSRKAPRDPVPGSLQHTMLLNIHQEKSKRKRQNPKIDEINTLEDDDVFYTAQEISPSSSRKTVSKSPRLTTIQSESQKERNPTPEVTPKIIKPLHIQIPDLQISPPTPKNDKKQSESLESPEHISFLAHKIQQVF